MLLVLSGFLHSSEDFVDYTIIFFFFYVLSKVGQWPGHTKVSGSRRVQNVLSGMGACSGIAKSPPLARLSGNKSRGQRRGDLLCLHSTVESPKSIEPLG